MGLTSFNRIRRLQEAKKRAQKVSDSDLKKVKDLCEELGVDADKVQIAMQALKSGAISVEQAVTELEEFKAQRELDGLNPEIEKEDLPSDEIPSENPATPVVEEMSPEPETGEVEVKEESPDEMPLESQETLDESAEVQTAKSKNPSSKKKNKSK